MDSSSSSPAAANPGFEDPELKMRRYLLLLASLAATVTYAAGLAPPGGTWAVSHGGNMAGSAILPATERHRYAAFYYCNATAFAASVVVIFLLVGSKKLEGARLRTLRTVMVLDLLALMAAYTAGGCRDKHSTVYTLTLVVALVSYLGIHISRALFFNDTHNAVYEASSSQEQNGQNAPPPPDMEIEISGPPVQPELPAATAPPAPAWQDISQAELELRRKVLMLLAIFAATITYVAGLKPPGGFWEHTKDNHRAGELILTDQHHGRFSAFFYCNTTAFMASLFTVVLLLHDKVTPSGAPGLYGCVVITLQTLVGAYAAGSCRNIPSTTYIFALVGVVLGCIFLLAVAAQCTATATSSRHRSPSREESRVGTSTTHASREQHAGVDALGEIRSLVLLLATLMATSTYQAGLNPPGGVWLENQDNGHSAAGDPILSSTSYNRYILFYGCNSAAFVVSILVILMVKIKTPLQSAVLHETMLVLGLFGLMVAYIAGSTRTLGTSLYVIILAAVFFVSVILFHVANTNTNNNTNTNTNTNTNENVVDDTATTASNGVIISEPSKKTRKRLLLLAILMAALTYQGGLSPPGGFWRKGHAAGSPVLLDVYPSRYNAFFYCNTTTFMASIALIILLRSKALYHQLSNSLYLCSMVGLLGLTGAFAAGSDRRLLTSLYVFLPVGVLFSLIAMWFPDLFRLSGEGTTPTTTTNNNNNNSSNTSREDKPRRKKKYLMLVAILAATVTYLAGLDPPGGVWPDGHAAWNGNSVLHDSNLRRYHVFFYGNSISFMASVIVIILLLQDRLHTEESLLTAMNTVVVLDLIGLLVAYAAGSTRTLKTSLYFIVPALAMVICILVHATWSDQARRDNSGDGQNGVNGQTERQHAVSQLPGGTSL